MTDPAQPARLVPEGLDGTLVLVRHGETDFIVEGRFQGQADSALSPLGHRQVELAGLRIADPNAPPPLPIPRGTPREILHSPLRRTTETAAAIGRAFAARGDLVTNRPEAGLLEIGQGAWEGLLDVEIGQRYATELAGWRRDPLATWAPGGESVLAVADRVRPALARALADLSAAGGSRPGLSDGRSPVDGYGRHAPGDQPWSVLVGHDGVFKLVVLLLLDLPLVRFWSFPFSLAGLTIVEFRAGRPLLRAHNLTAHLAPLALVEPAAASAADAAADDREQTGAL